MIRRTPAGSRVARWTSPDTDVGAQDQCAQRARGATVDGAIDDLLALQDQILAEPAAGTP